MRCAALLALLCLLPTSVSAQVGSLRVSFSAPTAASLGKFGDVPVSLASGLPDISVPIFTVKGKTLELPIALSYHGGGIRVEDIGSWVGTGWALEAGGTITRTVRGLVDESGSGYYNTGQAFYTGTNWQNPSVNFFQSILNKAVDPEPDQFFFNFAGRSGQFIMGPVDSTGLTKEIRTIPYQKIKLEHNPGFTQWTVTTEDGTKYTFAAQETTTDLSYSAPTGVMPDNYGETHVSTWHLTEIRSAGGDVINLYYSSYTARHRSSSYIEKFDNRYGNPAPCVPDQVETIGEQEVITQRLDSIKGAQHTVVFTVADSLRRDALSPLGVRQEPRLELITVRTPTGTVVRRFLLEHDYFGGDRLRLKNVYEQDPAGVSLPPYTFTYDAQAFPSRTSYEQDHWGYWNGRSLNTSLIPGATNQSGQYLTGADRSPDTVKVKIGSLTRITFPTGGYNEFIWEANEYGGIGQSQTQPHDFGPPQFASVTAYDFQYNQTDFTIGGADTVPVKFDFTLQPASCGTQIGCPYVEVVGVRMWHSSGSETVRLGPGTYTLRSVSDMSDGYAYLTASWQSLMPVNRKPGGGLRVREVRAADGMGNVQVRKFDYTLASNPAKSSGLINAEPAYHFTYASPDCGYFSRASQSKLPLGSGTSVSYSEVTVLYGASGEHGRSRETFRSIVHAPDQIPLTQQLPYVRTTSYQWQRGQRLDAFDYNSAGQTQRLVRSSYAFQDALPATTRSFRGLSTHSFSTQHGGTGGVYNPFQVISAWYYQDSDTTFTYNETGTSSFASARTYSYGNPEHVQLTQTVETNSDGTSRITRLKYPADYGSGSGDAEAIALTAMKSESVHMHSPVIERSVSDSVGGTVRVVRAELTTFKTFSGARYLPHIRFVLKSETPVTNFVPSTVAGTFTKDIRYRWQETASGYDAAGRITTHNDRWGYTTTFSYGGNVNAAFLTRTRRCSTSAACAGPNPTGGLIQAAGRDSLGNVTTMRDSLTFRGFTYDAVGRLREVRNHGYTRVQGYGYTYSRTGPNWTFNPTSPNVVVDTTYLQHTPTVLRVVRWTYLDGLGRPIQTVVQDGSTYLVTAQQYDALGREWRKWKPYPRSTAGYDANFVANATAYYNTYHGVATTPFAETQYTTDPLSRVKRAIPEFLGTTATEYTQHVYGVDATAKQSFTETEEIAPPIAFWSPLKTRSYRDAWGNEVKTILGYGGTLASTTLFNYNVLGQRTQMTDPRGLQTGYAYDTQGYQSFRTSPDAGNSSRMFDVMDNLRYSRDASQTAAGQVYFTNYDFGYRPLTSGLGAATYSALDPNAATPPALETNTANWLTVRAYDAKPSTAAFPWSRFTTQINAVALANVYGRLAATANKSNGAWQVQLFSYDSDGRVATRYTFTEANGGASVLTALNTTVNYTRDLRDSLAIRSVTVGANNWYQWYDYDNRGLLWKVFASTSATKPGTPDATYTYRPSGTVLSRQFQGGTNVTLRYTIREQLERIGTVEGGAEPFAARYVYRPDATVDTAEFRSEGAPTAEKRYRYAHTYDARKRLYGARFATFNGGWSPTTAYALDGITYDSAGNLRFLARNRADATTVDYLTYTSATGSNRLTTLSEQVGISPEAWDAEAGTFTYDANGNMLTSPAPYSITAATYDHLNLPTSLTRNGVTTTYRYNADGQRIAKQVGAGNTEYYILDGRTTFAVYSVNGAGTATSWHHNVVADETVVGRQVLGVKRYYHRDLLGSTRAVVQNGAIVESYDYDPWGVLLEGRILAGPTKEGFNGKERDAETGLDYYAFRYYMAAVGRWTTVDPLDDVSVSWNPYNYVENNPVALTDPFGLCTPWPDCWFQTAADWGAQRGGRVGTMAVNVAAAGNAGSEAAGLNDIGLAVSERRAGGTVVALAGLTPVGKVGKGLKAVKAAKAVKSARQRAVRQAWKQEVDLVQRRGGRTGGTGTRQWSDAEIDELLTTGKVQGYQGHHVNSVAGSPHLAGLAENIKFVRAGAEHIAEHGGNYRNPTLGQLIHR